MDERIRQSDLMLEQVFDLLKEVRDDQKDHRKETQTFALDQLGLRKDLNSLQTEVAEMKPQVEAHEAVYRHGKMLGTAFVALMSWLGWDTFKNHWPWGKH